MDIRRIRGITSELLDDCEITRPPVPIARIASASGAFVVLDGAMPDRIDGVLAVGADAALIRVNGRRGQNRQRWSMAHELGHFYLHAGSSPVTYMLSLHQEHTLEEREASRFAAELLMPEEWMRREWARCPLVETVCHLFCVSRVAVGLRLRELDLRRPSASTDPMPERGVGLGVSRLESGR